MFLNFVFGVHAAVAILVAFLLFFFTEIFTQTVVDSFVWSAMTPMAADVIRAYANLTGVGLVLIAILAGYAPFSGFSNVRWVVLRSLVAIGLVFIVVALLMSVAPLKVGILVVNLIFVAIYVVIWFFYREMV
jgi:hypothetical protein